MKPRSAQQRRYLTTSTAYNSPAVSAQDGFQLSAGRLLLGTGFEVIGGILRTKGFTNSSAQQMIPMGGYRGIELTPFGTGNDNSTFNYRIWAVVGQMRAGAVQENPNLDDLLDIELVCMVADASAVTLSAGLGAGAAGSELVLATERVGDTISATISTVGTTPPGPMTVWQNGNTLGTTQVYSPANDTPAHLLIPDCNCVFGIIPETDLVNATGANWLYRLKK